MFWIGLIVGIIIGMVVLMAVLVLFTIKYSNMSINEIAECGMLICDAGHNREATISLWHDCELLNAVELEEK